MTLTALTLTAAKVPHSTTAEQRRRNKLIRRLCEQRALAEAAAAGTVFAPTKQRRVRDTETGERRTVIVTKRVKQWWFATDDNRLALTVRYGSQILELARGKFSVDVQNLDQLPTTIDLVIEAVREGELDDKIAAAAGTLQRGFKK